MPTNVDVTVEDLSPIKKKIGVALPPEEVHAELEEAFRGLQRRASIKGFRPGKVPRSVLERYYGEQVRSEVIGRLNAAAAKALGDAAIRDKLAGQGLEVVAGPVEQFEKQYRGDYEKFGKLIRELKITLN